MRSSKGLAVDFRVAELTGLEPVTFLSEAFFRVVLGLIRANRELLALERHTLYSFLLII